MANLLLTCATKLTVNGTTTAPEHLMVCGNARFVNSGTNNIYMGTSHGSVDIDFNRAASQDLKIRTYSGGWNTALRILGTGVFACSYLQSPTLCATTCAIAHSLRQTTNQQYICLYGGCNDSSPGGMKFMSCGGTLRGYVYYDGTSNFGLLNCGGQWAIRIVGTQSSNSCMYTCHPLEATTCLKTPILCATSCTSYGACATSKLTSDGDNMRHTTQYGYMQFGPGNASYAHFNTDRPQFYFNKKLVVNAGQVESYDEDLILQRTSSGTNRIKITTDTTHICQYTNIAGKLAVNAAGCTCCCALNCGKADFEIITGGTATAAWTGGRFRVGADDVNWSTRIRQSGYFETYSSDLYLRVATADKCVIFCPHGTGFTKACGTLCATSKFQGSCLHVDGGNQNSDSDAAVYVTATNNNDWGIVVNKNNGSATDYAFDARMGASAGYAYYARFNNTVKFTVRHDCLCHASLIKSPIVCGPTCVSAAVLETSGSIVRWCYPSNCGPYLQTGGTYSAPTLALKRHDGDLNGNEFLAGKFCGAVCVRSPIVCGTSCLTTDGCLKFTQNTPTIATGGAYIIVPGGIYVNGGTFYAENTTMHRNGICDDTASTLDIWGGTGSNINLRGNTYACACLYVHCTLCMAPDSYGDMKNGITLGKVGGLPQAAWGESGSKTGRIEIGLPTRDGEGGTVHHGMVHVAIDVYEYNSNDATTIIVGGHNWNCRWYNCGAHMTGGCTDKTIKLAYHSCGGTNNGRYVILLGECDSTWTYGSVHVRSITNGLYYCDNMNMGTPWYVKRVTCADSHYNQTSGDLRSASNSMAGYQCAMVCFHGPRVCATTCLNTSVACASSVVKGGDWVCGNRICSAGCVLAAGCIHGNIVCGTQSVNTDAICVASVASISGDTDYEGLAIGQAYSNEGGWNTQLNMYGRYHDILRIKKCAGTTGDNAQCLSLYVHDGQAATIISTGNLLLKAGGGVGMCVLSGSACSAVIKGSTCVISPMVFPTGCLQFDQSGTRSWKICASGGNLNFHSGDGAGVHYFHTHLYATYLHSTGMVWGASCVCSPILCATGSIRTHLYRSGANNMCLCPSGCGYGLFLGPSTTGEKQHWVTSLFTASGTQARRAKLLEFSYNTHHWDSGGPIIIEIFRNYYGKGSSQKWQIVQTGLDGTGSQNCSAGADLPAGARDVALMLLESNGPDTNQFKLHVDMHAAGFKISDYDVGIAEVYLDVDYYAQVAAKVTLQGSWYNINTGASFTTASSSQYKFYNTPSYTNISTFHNSPPTVQSTGGRILYADRIYGKSYWQACCQNCYTNVCTRYLDFHGTSCLTNLNTSSTICSTGTVQGANVCGGLVCFTSCLTAANGCIKAPVIEGRYHNAQTCYRGGLCWNRFQLGNNGLNQIVAGNHATGGYLDIYTNNTADVLGGIATNGTHNARFCSNGYTHFMDWIQLADSKGIFTATNNGHFRGNTTSDYGTWDILGSRNNWGGIYMCGMTVMGYCDCGCHGLYNDVDNEWMVKTYRNGQVELFYNGAERFETYSNGVMVCANSHKICLYPHSSWAHFYTTAPKYYFDHEIRVNSGVVSSYDEPLKLATCGTVRAQVCETCVCSSVLFCTPSIHASSYINSGKFCAGSAFHCNGCSYVNGRVEGCCHIAGSSYFCYNCAVMHGTIKSTNCICAAQCICAGGGFYGDGSNLTGIAGGCSCFTVSSNKLTVKIGSCPIMCSANPWNCYDNTNEIGCQVLVLPAGIRFDGCSHSCTPMGHLLYGGQRGICWSCPSTGVGVLLEANGQFCLSQFWSASVINMKFCCKGIVRHGTSGCVTICGNGSNCACFKVCGTLSKSYGSFVINHPDPAKSETHDLIHSFVESPNEGDNIYRWQVETSECSNTIVLPSYYKHLNKNDMVWVSPYKHFGSAYGEVTTDQCCLVVCSNSDGCYNVLLVGTRKDETATNSWNGPEREITSEDREITDPDEIDG